MSNFSCHKLLKQTGNYCQKGIIIVISCLFFARMAVAIGSIDLSIDQFLLPLEPSHSQKQSFSKSHTQQLFKQLQLDKLTVKLEIGSSPIKITIALDRLNLPEPYSNLNELMITCLSLNIEASHIACTQGTVAIRGLFDELLTSADFSIDYHPDTDDLMISLNNMDIGDGRFSATIKIDKNQWLVHMDVLNIDYQTMKKYLNYYFAEIVKSIEEPGAAVSFSGQLSGSLATKNTTSDSGSLQEKESLIKTIALKGQIKNLSYAYHDDIVEKLNLDFRFKLQNTSDQTVQVTMALDNITGELFQNDIYLAFTGAERIESRANYQATKQLLNLERLFIKLPKILEIHSSGQINLAKDSDHKQLNTTLHITDLARFNDLYLKNILEGTDYEGLELEGALKGKVSNNNLIFDLNCQFSNLSLAFNEQIAIDDLNGHIYWNNKKQSLLSMPMSQLSWQEVSLNHLPFGAAQLNFKTQKDRLKLIQETDIPIFDGFLHINTLELTQIGQSPDLKDQQTGMNIAIDGMIKPISLDQVSNHFDWPLLDGKLSAVIPYTTYNEHLLELGGALMLQVFDGVIIVKDLKIEQPLSDNARLFSNIDLNNINLKSLTKTYNFGKIEGRVEGKLSQLELHSWQPVAFDAYIRTPANDKSSHRISQRAIDNLSSLGGASGILSRSFLSFFETFRYDKLGLSCKLKNNICEMNGIESSTGNGYYIVKGGGIPRIDVMGFQHQVNWHVLTSRLKAIQSANQAVIE